MRGGDAVAEPSIDTRLGRVEHARDGSALGGGFGVGSDPAREQASPFMRGQDDDTGHGIGGHAASAGNGEGGVEAAERRDRLPLVIDHARAVARVVLLGHRRDLIVVHPRKLEDVRHEVGPRPQGGRVGEVERGDREVRIHSSTLQAPRGAVAGDLRGQAQPVSARRRGRLPCDSIVRRCCAPGPWIAPGVAVREHHLRVR